MIGHSRSLARWRELPLVTSVTRRCEIDRIPRATTKSALLVELIATAQHVPKLQSKTPGVRKPVVVGCVESTDAGVGPGCAVRTRSRSVHAAGNQ